MALQLRNPHSVLAVFETRPTDIVEVRLPIGQMSDAWADVEQAARSHRVPVLDGRSSQERSGRRGQRDVSGGRAGAAEATVKERRDVPLETLFDADASEVGSSSAGRRRLWLALDQIQDPHNVGAIFRTAAFFGVAGIVVTRDRSAPMNGTVYDVASGGMEVVPFANPANLSRALEVAKKSGLWVLGTSEHAKADVHEIDRARSWILVLGNEERGLRRLTAANCDELCALRATGPISSLNVSVAAGVLMAVLAGRVSGSGSPVSDP